MDRPTRNAVRGRAGGEGAPRQGPCHDLSRHRLALPRRRPQGQGARTAAAVVRTPAAPPDTIDVAVAIVVARGGELIRSRRDCLICLLDFGGEDFYLAPQPVTQIIAGEFKIEPCLQVQPESLGCAKKTS